MDGLAFLFLPKWDIKPLAAKESSGFISGKEGLSLERRVLRALAIKAKRVAILNDLTTCLRYGDITVASTSPFILEVKSGSRRTARDHRQQERATEVAQYLSRDVWRDWSGTGWTMQRTALLVPERHHRRVLSSLIIQARRNGTAVKRVERGVFYVAVGSTDPRPVLDALARRLQAPFTVPIFRDFVPTYYLPLALSVTDSYAWWLTVTGEVLLLVVIDRQRVVELFAEKGLQAAWDDTDRPLIGPGWTVSSASATEHQDFAISSQFFGRVAGEFLSLQWFVDEAVARFERGPVAIDPTSAAHCDCADANN